MTNVPCTGKNGVLMKTLGAILFVTFFCSAAYCQETAKKVFSAPVDADGVQRVSVTAGEYFFEPYHIIVKVRMPVELSVKKTSGVVPHDIVIDAPDAGITVNESLDKEQKTIRFTPGKTGRYPFYCTKRFLFFKSHKERGMEGILEVVE